MERDDTLRQFLLTYDEPLQSHSSDQKALLLSVAACFLRVSKY